MALRDELVPVMHEDLSTFLSFQPGQTGVLFNVGIRHSTHHQRLESQNFRSRALLYGPQIPDSSDLRPWCYQGSRASVRVFEAKRNRWAQEGTFRVDGEV